MWASLPNIHCAFQILDFAWPRFADPSFIEDLFATSLLRLRHSQLTNQTLRPRHDVAMLQNNHMQGRQTTTGDRV